VGSIEQNVSKPNKRSPTIKLKFTDSQIDVFGTGIGRDVVHLTFEAMLKNYMTVAFRAFTRNITFSIIHILGLSIGISAALVIYLLVRYENSFDTFEDDGDRIYRVVMDMKFGDLDAHSPAVPAPAAMAIQNEVSGVEAPVPMMQFQGDATAKVMIARAGEQVVFKKQPGIVFTSNPYFDLLPFQWLAGSKSSALSNPFSVVLTESRATQYFPQTSLSDVVGKAIQYNDDLTMVVTGIVKDFDKPSDLTALEFISYATIAKTHLQERFLMNVWNDWMAYSKLYVKLSKGTVATDVQAGMNAMFQKYGSHKDAHNKLDFVLQPLSDIHFNLQYAGFGQRTADRTVLMGLLAIAAFLLLLACINFTNLATAQASQRAREIGIRKTSGGSRSQLVIQFLSETFFITLLAMLVSAGLTPALLEFFAEFLPVGLHFNLWRDPSVISFLVVLTVTVSFVAGLYPAVILSGYKPSAVLKNYAFAGMPTRRSGIRKLLTVSQFVIAQFFVIAAFMVGKQIHFATSQDLGHRKEAILNFELPFDTIHYDRIRNEISRLREVENVSVGFLPPAMEGSAFSNITYDDGKAESQPTPNDRLRSVQLRFGDANYLDVYQIKLIAGRNVREGQDINETLINESYAKALGFRQPADALGKELLFSGTKRVPIVGVMQDFHEASFHMPIGPLVYQSRTEGNFFHVALRPQPQGTRQWQEAIAKIGDIVNETYPDADVSYQFFDDTLAQLYATEHNTSVLLNWATALSVLISCLGLLGLVIYTSAVRTKEIGVRKILGASVSHIVSLLSAEFVKLVLIAFVIAAPLAAWAIDTWLQTFAYRTPISWWVFVVCGLTLIVVAMITLSIQTLRTARANPVNSLRNE
jgi:putative ABC transport system permease protein